MTTEPSPPRFCPWCGAPARGGPVCATCERELTDSRIGTVVADRYRIDALLAEGGMGRVYRATHLALGGPVVLKFLIHEWSALPEARARFRREAQVLARLRHPAIVSVHDFGEVEGTPFIAMELLEGHTLAAEMGAPLPAARIGLVFDQILEGLEAAHQAGVIHRDLKPANVMVLDAGDRIKLLDFGMAFVTEPGTERLTTPGAIQGTPLYMSPEQCQGAEVGPKSDVYSLGVMLYEALAGRVPFSGKSGADVIAKHVYFSPPPLDEIPGLIPAPGLEALAQRALAKKPEERPGVTELREALAAALKGGDPASQAARAASERIAGGGQSREERALPKAATTQPAPTPLGAVVAAPSDQPRVVLWGLPQERASGLRDVLAVNGLRAVVWRTSDPPRACDQDGTPFRCLLIGGERDPAQATEAVRAHPELAELPVLVLDLERAESFPSLIRAGASDVALARVADGLLCRQVWRLIRRGR